MGKLNFKHLNNFLYFNLAQAFERMMSPTGPVPNSSVSSENSSAPPLQEACIPGSASCPLFSSPLPVSALKQSDNEGMFNTV